jgi:hypothetical protein
VVPSTPKAKTREYVCILGHTFLFLHALHFLFAFVSCNFFRFFIFYFVSFGKKKLHDIVRLAQVVLALVLNWL